MKSMIAAIGLIVLTSTAQADAFTIYNNGSHIISEIHQSSVTDISYGPDLLDGYLHPGASWTSPTSGLCNYDIAVVFLDGSVDTESNWNVCDYDLKLNY